MIAAYFVAVLLFVILFFVFLHKSPKGRKGVLAYNIGVYVVIAILCAWYIWNLYGDMNGTVDSQWFYVIAPLTAFGIAIVVLTVGGLLRNYVVFRR
jgi:hypothetical protein